MDRLPHFSLRTAMASSEASETDAEREVREAKEQKIWEEEEKEEDRWVNMIITDLLDEYIGLDKPLWNTDKKDHTFKPDYRDKLCFLYSVSGGGFDWMNERMNAYNTKRRKEFLAQALKGRDVTKDMLVMFGDEFGPCRPDQIAHSMREITKETRAYVGVLEKGIFEKLPKTIEHIYTKFPEGRIWVDKNVFYGGKIPEEITRELHTQGDQTDQWSEFLLKKLLKDTRQESVDVIRLSVGSMGFPRGATRQQIYDRTEELGLRVNIPPELGPVMRLRDRNQALDTWYYIGMKPITGLDGNPDVFYVLRDDGGSRWLNANDDDESRVWVADHVWAFVRK